MEILSEEEIIEILKDNIENCNAWLEDNDTEDIIWWKNQKQAIIRNIRFI